MIKINELKGVIASKGLSQRAVALELGITPKTFYIKMKKGVFGSDEIEKMIEILEIKNPTEIFFVSDVTCKVTNELV